jgi:GAF domain-containing protein
MRWYQSLRNMGLSVKLNLVVVFTLAMMLVVLIAVTRSLENFTTQTGRQQAEQEVEVVRRRFAEAEQELLANTQTLATTPGLAEAVTNRDAEEARTILLISAAWFGFNLDDIDVVDAHGEHILVIEEDETLDTAQEDALLTLALIGSAATSLIVEEEEPAVKLRLAAVAPLRDTSSGELVGGLLTSHEVDGKFLTEINLGRENVQIVPIVQGRILLPIFSSSGSEEYEKIKEFSSVLLDKAAIGQALNGQTVIAEDILFSEDGLPYALAHIPLTVGGDTRAALGVLTKLGGLLAFQRQLITSSSIIFVFLAVAAVVVIALFAVRGISVPINRLRSVAERMESGDYGQRVEITSADEVGQLAHAFNSMAAQLQELIGSLEQRVAERTRRLEIVAAFGERLSAILKLEELLAEVVNGIQESFGYYHAHIYLFDDKRENLVVAAGTGEAGAEMKAKGHHIPLNAPASLVARAARTGQIVRVDNVRETEEWLPNPLLPDTHSEMAVPIILSAEGQVVGVLDVQQDEVAGLDEGDAALLRSLANQVAVAIRNAHLFAEIETALAEAREAQRRFVEQAWDRSQVARQGRGRVQFSMGESTTLSEAALVQARQQALALKEPAVVTINGSEEESGGGESGNTTHHALVVPITLGETTIGNLQLHEVDPNRKWTESDLALISAVIDQVAQTAENLRLLNETQERASREQLIGQISDRLRRAPDVETLMKTAVAELSRVLDPARTFVRLGPTEELSVTQAEEPSSDKISELEVEAQVEGDSTMDAELEFGVVQRETSGSSEPAELEVQAQVEADSVPPSAAELDLAREEELSNEELPEAEAPVEIEDDLVTLPEDTSAQSVDNEAEREDEPHIMPD